MRPEPAALVAIEVLLAVDFCYALTVDDDRGTPGADRSAQPFSVPLPDLQQH